MPYITREDGEHFVIPSYRDEISAKNNSALKNEIIELSQSYGDYITMQRKASLIYDVAFSPDTGYLLGETVWHHFNRPVDLVYCEAVANTTEAILVIVKEGEVYLDGRFPMESIPEELIIFLTQKNNFDIYIYGDVPIAKEPAEGKFSFDSNSIKSFTILTEPVFATLPLLKAYQLQLVEPTLKRYGFSGVNVKQLVSLLILAGIGWAAWSIVIPMFKAAPIVEQAPQIDPYQGFYDALNSPAPDATIENLVTALNDLVTIPGWTLVNATYTPGSVSCDMQSQGASVEDLISWADAHQGKVTISSSGISLNVPIATPSRSKVNKIYSIQEVLAVIIDRLVKVYPGNNVQIAEVASQGSFSSIDTSINITDLSLSRLAMVAKQLQGLPLVIVKIMLNNGGSSFNGVINMKLLGS